MPAHFRPLFAPTVTVTTASLPGGTTTVGYSQQLAAIGGTPPYTWYIVGGALPNGIGLNAAGLLSGTPTVVATFTFTVQAQDQNGLCGAQTLSITVASGSSAGTWFGATLPTLPTQFSTTSSPPAPAATNRGSYYTPGVGGDAGLTLQAAINAAAAATGSLGDVIVCAAGTTLTTTTSFNLAARVGSGTIYIMSSSAPEIGGSGLPSAGVRVTPANIPQMASLRTSQASGGMIISRASGAGVSSYRFVGLDIELTDANTNAIYCALFNNGDTSVVTQAQNITFDRCYIAGAPTLGVRHAIGLEGVNMEATECYIERVFQQGVGDTQCVVAFNSTGPYKVHNCWLNSQGQSFLFGGSDTTLPSPNMPSDASITNNHCFKQWFVGTGTLASGSTTLTVSAVTSGVLTPGMAVQDTSGFLPNGSPTFAQVQKQLTGTPGGAGTYQLSIASTGTSSGSETLFGSPFGKNMEEFKVANRMLMDSNFFEHAGALLQPRSACVLTGRNQSGGNPWYGLFDLTITNNVFTDCLEGGINVLLQDNNSTASNRILVRNNLFILSRTDGTSTTCTGFLSANSPTTLGAGAGSNIVFDHNTFIATAGQSSSFIFCGHGAPTSMALTNMVWSNNIFDASTNGITDAGGGVGYANVVPRQSTPVTWVNNVHTGSTDNTLPAGNFKPALAAVGFTSYGSTTAAAGYQLTTGSTFHAAGVSGLNLPANSSGTPDSTDIGCNIPALPSISTLVNWAPGHYLQFGENDTAASRVATINALPAQPGGGGIVGVIDPWVIGHLDNGTTGPNYQFADPNSVIAACKSRGLKYILDVASRSFGSASFTGVIPQWYVNNNWGYTRPAGPAAGGATVWLPATMTAKTNLELAFVNQTGFLANYVTGTNPTMMGWSSDESVIGQNLTTSQPYSAAALVSAEINQRWLVLRQQVPQLAVILYTNFMTSDTGGSTNMLSLFTTAASLGGILVNGGPDCFAQNVPGSSETPGQQCADGQIGGVNYCGPAYGVLGGVQNAETVILTGNVTQPGTTTFQQVFKAFDGHFQAQYQQWYETPSWGVVGATGPFSSQLKTFLTNNPVTHTAYPQNWPGATQPSFTQVFSYTNFTGIATASTTTAPFASATPITILNGSTVVTAGGGINLLPNINHQIGCAYYNTQQPTGPFTTTFTFQFNSSLTPPISAGFAFAVQNSPNLGAPFTQFSHYALQSTFDANDCGYGAFWNKAGNQSAMVDSIGIKFDMGSLNGNGQGYVSGSFPSGIGLYVNGGPSDNLTPFDDVAPNGINFFNGHIFSCTIVYDGALLTAVLTDTTTNAQVRKSWPVNTASAIGSSTAWVGFCSGATVGTAPNLTILSWSYSSLASSGANARLATPTFSVAPGAYIVTQNVALSGPSGASVYYSTNGQPPTSSSTLYTGTPIAISASTLLQAVAIQSGFPDSQVASANYTIGPANTPTVNFPSGFAGASGICPVGSATIVGSAVQITDSLAPANGEVGGVWFASPVYTSKFSTTFTFSFPGQGSTSHPNNGIVFVLQSQPPSSVTCISHNGDPTGGVSGNVNSILWVAGGITTLGQANQGLGYGGATGGGASQNPVGLYPSVGVKFNLNNNFTILNSTGLYLNGADPGNATSNIDISPVSLANNDTYTVTLTYDIATLTLAMTIQDTHGHSFSRNMSTSLNIPSIVGSTAYVGFTGATGFFSAVQNILTWTGF